MFDTGPLIITFPVLVYACMQSADTILALTIIPIHDDNVDLEYEPVSIVCEHLYSLHNCSSMRNVYFPINMLRRNMLKPISTTTQSMMLIFPARLLD